MSSESAPPDPIGTAPPSFGSGAPEFTISFEVASEDGGRRLDSTAAKRLPRLSRTEVARWVEAGFVLIDGRVRRPGYRCRAGQTVRIAGPAAGAPRFRPPGEREPLDPEPVPLKILHEDEHLVVLDKPPGIVVHPGPGHPGGSLANGLLHRYPEMSAVGPPGRPGLVHRLDRGTSGVLVAARTETARRRLAESFARRQVEKRYLALVLGRFPGLRRMAEPIGRDPRNSQRYRIRGKNAREALSEARPLEELPLSTLVALSLGTGRTHQARVHLAGAGFPIAGDAMYGPSAPRRGGGRAGAALRRLERPALHAAEIGFLHPASGETVRFAAPLFEDLDRTLAALRQASTVEEGSTLRAAGARIGFARGRSR